MCRHLTGPHTQRQALPAPSFHATTTAHFSPHHLLPCYSTDPSSRTHQFLFELLLSPFLAADSLQDSDFKGWPDPREPREFWRSWRRGSPRSKLWARLPSRSETLLLLLWHLLPARSGGDLRAGPSALRVASVALQPAATFIYQSAIEMLPRLLFRASAEWRPKGVIVKRKTFLPSKSQLSHQQPYSCV